MTRISRRSLAAAMLGAVTGAALMTAAAPACAASGAEIDARAEAALTTLYAENAAAKALGEKAVGILVFPDIVKAGFGIGGEYGEGALRRAGQTTAYYNLVSASFGLQIGAQDYGQAIFFMTEEALGWLDRSMGFELGVDGSVAVASTGAAGELDSTTLSQPVIVFTFGQQGLMANATIEGSKISRIER